MSAKKIFTVLLLIAMGIPFTGLAKPSQKMREEQIGILSELIKEQTQEIRQHKEVTKEIVNDLWPGFWAGAQAFGSVIAILVAIRISRSEMRQIEKDKMVAANVVATDWRPIFGGLVPVMEITIDQLNETFTPITKVKEKTPELNRKVLEAQILKSATSQIERKKRDLYKQFELMNNIFKWNTDDIIRLIPLGCVQTLYEARGSFFSAQGHFFTVSQQDGFFTDEIRNGAHVNGMCELLIKSRDKLRAVVNILEKAEASFRGGA